MQKEGAIEERLAPLTLHVLHHAIHHAIEERLLPAWKLVREAFGTLHPDGQYMLGGGVAR